MKKLEKSWLLSSRCETRSPNILDFVIALEREANKGVIDRDLKRVVKFFTTSEVIEQESQ